MSIKKSYHKIGFALLILFSISYLGVLLVIFTWPLYILGLYFIWKSDLRKLTKQSWTFFPALPLLIVIFYGLFSSITNSYHQRVQTFEYNAKKNNAIENRFMLNNNFDMSSITLVHNSNCPSEYRFVDLKVIEYEVPNDGIVFMNGDVNYFNKITFFYKDLKGVIKEIEYHENDIHDTNKIIITGCKGQYRDFNSAANHSRIRYLRFVLVDTREKRIIKKNEKWEDYVYRLNEKIIKCKY